MENYLAEQLTWRLKTTSLKQGGGVLWRERHRRAQGVNMGRMVRKFSMTKKSNLFLIYSGRFSKIY